MVVRVNPREHAEAYHPGVLTPERLERRVGAEPLESPQPERHALGAERRGGVGDVTMPA